MSRDAYWILLMLFGGLAGCDGGIYVRDGVTDGDSFYVPPAALTSPSSSTQSWIAYSLALSTCQLQRGGENPARNSSFQCELRARKLLAERWSELATVNDHDRYLDDLAKVHAAGFLAEYTHHYLMRNGWKAPAGLHTQAFAAWRKRNLRQHRARTRLVGSWNYHHKVGLTAVE
jgi:hypothetical protein